MKVLLISTYELGRQPFSIASPAAWLSQEGHDVDCLDLSIEMFTDHEEKVNRAEFVAFSLPMHTATRLAVPVAARVRELNPSAHLCFYGLYAPMNRDYLTQIGADSVLGGEFEEGLVSLVGRLRDGLAGEARDSQPEPLVSLSRQKFKVPDRSRLPVLSNYAQLQTGPDESRVVGYTEATRGCKHRCRHCPVVPVYDGNFRVVQQEVVLEDIRQQVASGAQHITFGDPDFFNGPTHAVKIVQELHRQFPDVTYDATIKVQHLLQQREHLPTLRDTGCAFVTCAVESVDDRVVVEIFEKNHTRSDFIEAVHVFREVGLEMNPTFVTFHPWITVKGYLDLLRLLVELQLVDNLAPIQLAIRLLITDSSRLLELQEVRDLIEDFDQEKLYYPWSHPDPAVDALQAHVLEAVQASQSRGETRREAFQRVWKIAHEACEECAGQDFKAALLDQRPPEASIYYLTEPWYC